MVEVMVVVQDSRPAGGARNRLRPTTTCCCYRRQRVGKGLVCCGLLTMEEKKRTWPAGGRSRAAAAGFRGREGRE